MPNTLPIAIYYEQPHWFKPLFAELDRRGTPYVKLFAPEHSYSPSDHPEELYSLVFNRMSPSAWNRDHGDQIFYTLGFLEHLASRGVKVLNGYKAFQSELSKAGQLVLAESLGLPYPKARVIHRPEQALAATEGLRWPIVVKPNIGGSGAGVKRFDGASQLRHAIAEPAGSPDALQFGLDSTALVQEFIPAEGAHIVRVEVLNGKYLYAIKVHITGETFDLCPADICRTTTGTDLNRAACAIDAPKSGITVEAFTHPRTQLQTSSSSCNTAASTSAASNTSPTPVTANATTTTSTPSPTSSPTAPASSASTPSPVSSTGSKPKPASLPLPLYKCCHPEAEPKDLCV